MLRLPGEDTQLLGIDRAGERLAAKRAASLGIGPAVLHADDDCLVTAFVVGSPVDSERLRADPAGVGRALRSFHDSGLELPSRFWVAGVAAASTRRSSWSAGERCQPPTRGRRNWSTASRG